ncbi:MAG: DsbA family protein [Rhizobiaceae bacterium]|nr:DsbA family protein [Rhizobiaceae bacterium]
MKFSSLFAATALSLVSVAGGAQAFDDGQKEEIGKIVREYLIAHPEIMIEVQQALEKKQADERAAQAKVAVSENADAIFNASADIALGNPKGKTTIVEFFDYNCGYCKRALSDMDAIIKSNPDVRFVLKEFPILGQDSLDAHKVSYAFKQIAPEKYGDFHRALLSGEHADEARAIEVAKSLGVSEEALRAKMEQAPHDDSVRDAYRLASKLGITGTPSYVLGNEAVFGAIGESELNQKIASVRQCGKTTC